MLPSGLVYEGCVREGCPARRGARLGDAAIAATHSSSAGALTEDACKAPHSHKLYWMPQDTAVHLQQCQVYSYECVHPLADVWSVMHANQQMLLCHESTVAVFSRAVF